MERIRVVQVGVGAIGREVCRLVLERLSLKLVGAIDTDPDLVGQPLGEVLGLPGCDEITISGDAEAVLESADPDVFLQVQLFCAGLGESPVARDKLLLHTIHINDHSAFVPIVNPGDVVPFPVERKWDFRPDIHHSEKCEQDVAIGNSQFVTATTRSSAGNTVADEPNVTARIV